MTTTPTTRTAIDAAATRPTPARRRPRRARSLATMGRNTFTGALALLFLFPMVWAAVSSVSPQGGTAQTDGIGLGNYRTLIDYQAGVGQYLLNSMFVSGLTVLLTVVVSLLGGYAFARFEFPGKNLLFLGTLAILMVPYATLLIPLYVLLNGIGLQNSLVGLALVLTMFQLPFATFMMRISFEAVPKELEEAALVDGCGTFTALVRVLLPAVRAGLITVGLFAFLAAWNDFITPLILVSDSDKIPLPLAIANLRGQTMGIVDYGATEAGVVVLAAPCILIFLLLQRHYVRGFMSGALKG
ncbi:carbohydrate ABC transporter permease [Rhodococcus sp. BP-316]|uniref:carbohydrate ABC transporter permease n=1 Tax=unclassified Rhodococcus (in: high G+C Gram-positive bacteria) TaxID=192944 RepID=UPI001C9A5D34|nr:MULTISPECIES: carbohydrate ABC transporter permease [unclassified Rhodococcus (in: high G+C Gram-positive bacteria)]MBY6682400.1 carbohydrate ABC transporter permease [Rhodococcus sp. BP-316]MBY6706287.1 carbohydrate ABC transporter permease [Rhodococcus sp. BP-241]